MASYDFPVPASPEWELILLAVQPHQHADDVRALHMRMENSLDWTRCHRMAAAHGVRALVHRRLTPWMPTIQVPEIWDRWTAECAAESRSNLARLVDLRRVLEAYDQKKIPVLVVKGPVLGVCLYGDIALRPFGDLDLVVPFDERDRAIECLKELDFIPQFQLTTSERTRFYRRYSEMHFTSAATGTLIDLHWELLSHRYRYAQILDGYWDRTTAAHIGPVPLKTLSAPDLFVFLLLHAAKHEWRCLGWLVDLAWLQAQRTPTVGDHSRPDQLHWDQLHWDQLHWDQLHWDDRCWDQLQSDAQRLGFGRIVTIGRRLGEKLFSNSEIGCHNESTATDDPLVAEILAGMTLDVEVQEPLHHWPWQRIHWRALDRATDRLQYAYDLLLAPTPLEWKTMPLPFGLTWLYPFIRMARLIAKYAGGRKPR